MASPDNNLLIAVLVGLGSLAALLALLAALFPHAEVVALQRA